MKNLRIKAACLLLLSAILTFPILTSAQESSTDALHYEVNRAYPALSITKDELTEASTLSDLNRFYKPEWVKSYVAVEVSTTVAGNLRKAASTDGTLNQGQKEMMAMADVGADILVHISYLPENDLRNNEIKEDDFSLTVDPETEASYEGGREELEQYLHQHAISKIPEGTFEGYALAAVKFTIDEKGQVSDAEIFESAKDDEIDKLLVETINGMTDWNPAEYANGVKAKQEFVLTVGNMESCIVPLLNIRKEID